MNSRMTRTCRERNEIFNSIRCRNIRKNRAHFFLEVCPENMGKELRKLSLCKVPHKPPLAQGRLCTVSLVLWESCRWLVGG